jgi:hypothetical protein
LLILIVEDADAPTAKSLGDVSYVSAVFTCKRERAMSNSKIMPVSSEIIFPHPGCKQLAHVLGALSSPCEGI